MGTYNPGVFGTFKGKVGSVVACRWKGLKIVKNYPEKSSKPKSLGQLSQTTKFSLVAGFLKRANGHIAVGYQGVSGAVTPYNVALRHHLNEAVTGAYPNFQLDFEKVQLSLPNSVMDFTMKPSIVASALGMVKISWQLDAKAGKFTLPTDKAHIMMYNPAKKQGVSVYGGIPRSALSFETSVPDHFTGDVLHTWLFFVSADGKIVSETSYLNTVTILE